MKNTDFHIYLYLNKVKGIALYAGGLIATIGWWIKHPDTVSDKEIARMLVENINFPLVR